MIVEDPMKTNEKASIRSRRYFFLHRQKQHANYYIISHAAAIISATRNICSTAAPLLAATLHAKQC